MFFLLVDERKKNVNNSHLIQNSYFPFIFYLYFSECPIANGNAHDHLSINTHTHIYETTTNVLLPLAAAAAAVAAPLAHSDIGVADNGHTLLHSLQWEYRVCIDFTTSIILWVFVTVNWTHAFENQIDSTSWRNYRKKKPEPNETKRSQWINFSVDCFILVFFFV